MAVINPTQVLINGTIIGGTINNTAIGGTTPAAGTFTTLIGGSGSANYEQITGGATGKAVQFQTLGSDANISQVFQSKGTGAIDLAAGSSGVNISNGGTVTALTRTVTGSGYTTIPSVVIAAPTTSGGVQATANALMFLAGSSIAGGGTGYTAGDVLTAVGGTFSSVITLTVSTVSSGVITAATVTTSGNYSVLPTNPVSVTGGTGTGATFNITWGVTAFTITNAGSGYVEQPTVSFSGGGGSAAAAYATVGAGSIIRSLGSTGTQSLDFYTPASISNGIPSLRVRDTTGDSYVMIQPGIGSGNVVAQGSSTANLNIASNGSGSVVFNTNGTSGLNQLRVTHTASAVNYAQVTGAATGGKAVISSQGSDTSVGLQYVTKALGYHEFVVATKRTFQIGYTTNAADVNYLQVNSNSAGNAPILSAQGSDTDIDLTLTPKGAGAVRFGTYTASVLTPTGYITIKDSGGTTRRLLVG